MKIIIFGMWHQGVVMASCLSKHHLIDCYDTNTKNLKLLKKGLLPVNEPGLKELFFKSVNNSRVKLINQPTDLKQYDAIIVAHDTIVDNFDNSKFNEINQTSRILNKSNVSKSCTLINFTQCPVGYTQKLFGNFNAHYIPENLQLGTAINDFLNPRLPIIGSNKKINLKKINQIFQFNISWKTTGLNEAEFIKNCLNSFLALSISFGNELGVIANSLNIDQYQVIKLLKNDPRLSKVPILPGVPYSGATLARDVKNLNKYAKSLKIDSIPIVKGIHKSNNNHKKYLLSSIINFLRKNKINKIIFIGLTYKMGSSTMRRSVMYEFLQYFEKLKFKCKFYDPEVSKNDIFKLNLKQFSLKENPKNNLILISKPILSKRFLNNLDASNKSLSLINFENKYDKIHYIFK